MYERTSACCKKLVTFERGGKPIKCPHCGTPYWDKPEDERRLFILQDRYIKGGRRDEDLGLIFLDILKYSENIVKNAVRSRKWLTQDDLMEKSQDIATIFIESYLRNPEFIVENSFGGLLIKYSKGVLYGSQNHDRTLSTDKIFSDSMSIATNPLFFIKDEDLKERYKTDVHKEFLQKNEKDLVTEISTIIDMIYERLEISESPANRIKYLLGMKNFFKLNKNSFMIDYYEFSGNKVKQHIENSKLLIRRYLMDNQRSGS